jgi:branched-chain amino acid transport system substrate-binding protein
MIKTAGKLVAISAIAGLAMMSAAQAEVLKLGLSGPKSGAAAAWGIGFEWAAKQAAEKINKEGGIKADGKTYTLEIVSYDNQYNATEGAKVAQTLLNRDEVKFVVGSIGTAPVKALQSLSERKGVLIFTTAWGPSAKGPNFPLTFTQINTPAEVLDQLYGYVVKQNPNAKTVAMLNPNDATGQDTEKVAQESWKKLNVKVLASDWYERGTTEFQPIATKLATIKPDIIDLSTTPPNDAGAILKELKVLGWKGVQVVSAGTSSSSLIKVAGDAVEGTYMGLAADFDGPAATPIQRELNKGANAANGDPLNVITIGSWDAVMALKAAIEKCNCTDPKKVAEALPTIVFESSYGPAAFGAKDVYGTPQQLLVPTIVTQIKGGKVVEVQRVVPPELDARLKAAKK